MARVIFTFITVPSEATVVWLASGVAGSTIGRGAAEEEAAAMAAQLARSAARMVVVGCVLVAFPVSPLTGGGTCV